MNDLEIYSYGVPIVLGLILAEVIYSSSKNLGYYSLKDSLAGYGLLAGNIIINFPCVVYSSIKALSVSRSLEREL